MKKLIAWFFFLTVMTLPVIGIESNNDNKLSASELGIDLTGTYTGTEVEAMIEIVLEESDRAIKEAYADGYKAAMLETKPDEVRYKVEADLWEERSNDVGPLSWDTGLLCFSVGMTVGSLLMMVLK